jgi:hypothetical protein
MALVWAAIFGCLGILPENATTRRRVLLNTLPAAILTHHSPWLAIKPMIINNIALWLEACTYPACNGYF